MSDKKHGIVPFEGEDGQHYFRVVSGNGERQAVGEGYTREHDRDRGIDAFVRTVVADSVQVINPKEGDVIVIRHRAVEKLRDVAFLQGWANGLRAHIEAKYGVRTSVLILPDYLDVDCLTVDDMKRFGWIPAPRDEAPAGGDTESK